MSFFLPELAYKIHPAPVRVLVWPVVADIPPLWVWSLDISLMWRYIGHQYQYTTPSPRPGEYQQQLAALSLERDVFCMLIQGGKMPLYPDL